MYLTGQDIKKTVVKDPLPLAIRLPMLTEAVNNLYKLTHRKFSIFGTSALKSQAYILNNTWM